MVAPVANRLLPVLAGIVVLLVAFVVLRTCTAPAKDTAVLAHVPVTPTPDADSPADTIKTLTANVAAMTTELQSLRSENAGLRKDNAALLTSRTQIEDSVTNRVTQTLRAQQQDDASRARLDADALATLTHRVDALTSASTHGSDIPIGLGLDRMVGPEQLVWIEPLDAPTTAPGGGLTTARPQRSALSATGASHTNREVDGAVKQLPPRPVFTVPRNATLIGSTAMTALVGRVPVKGQVHDPMPFKIITGADNLAANGLMVPGVQGMVWSGTAVGDWTLGCVTGGLESVTFVFDDGTIRTMSSDDPDIRSARSGGTAKKNLGWISDAYGIPCISGSRKTNAPAFLTQRLGITALEAAGQASAAAQTTTVVGTTGQAANNVTGDAGSYVLGKTLAGGSEELARWLLERQSQNFDAVFVPAGAAVAIHVDVELPIDFDPNGRKLSHASAANHAARRLD